MTNILTVAADWLNDSGYQPVREEWVAGARPLLGAMCPPHHWMTALDVLDTVATLGLTPAPAALHDVVTAEPVAATHVAAGSVAWLHGTPGAVLDPQTAHRTLAHTANDFAPMVVEPRLPGRGHG